VVFKAHLVTFLARGRSYPYDRRDRAGVTDPKEHDMILVTGGTGTLGSALVPKLQGDVRVLSRTARDDYVQGDLTTGEGIDAAVEGVDTIIHCAGASKGDEQTTATLVEAAKRAGTPHIVYISVVGADRVPVVTRTDRAMFGYIASKRAAERVVAESGLPWTTLRATQFHDLAWTTVSGMAKLPVIPVPRGFRWQPVETGEVASRLVELALGAPAGLVDDIAGPRVYAMDELLRGYLKALGKHRVLVPLRLPGQAARAFRDGANLAPDHAVGVRTWEEYLAVRLN
jgi:uncharacterized protein YbjT (DUF2867 family)